MDNQSISHAELRELALFAGAGGGILGGKLLGWRTVCAVEIDPYAASVLVARQNDGILPPFPIWDDIRTFDGRPWRGIVDVVSGGFPCQDISCAGKGRGIEGEQSGLWREMARIIREVRPQYVFVENSPMLLTARKRIALLIQVVASLFGRFRLRTIIALKSRPDILRVLGDLAEMGYDAEWGVLGADDASAPHIRKRIWILAHTCCARRRENSGGSHEDESQYVGGRETQANKSHGDGQGSREGFVADSPKYGRKSWGTGNAPKESERRKPDRGGEQRDVSNTHGQRLEEQRGTVAGKKEFTEPQQCDWWKSEPDVGRVAYGVAARVDRLKAIGNGQVPAVAALAWNTLIGRIYES